MRNENPEPNYYVICGIPTSDRSIIEIDESRRFDFHSIHDKSNGATRQWMGARVGFGLDGSTRVRSASQFGSDWANIWKVWLLGSDF